MPRLPEISRSTPRWVLVPHWFASQILQLISQSLYTASVLRVCDHLDQHAVLSRNRNGGKSVTPRCDVFGLIWSYALVRPLGAFGLSRSHHRVLGIFRYLQVSVALRLRVSSGIWWQTLQRVHQSTSRVRNLHAALDDTQ